MFSGIIQGVGTIRAREERSGDLRLVIDSSALDLRGTRVGDSVAVSGVCLTVTEIASRNLATDVSRETLALTTLKGLAVQSRVNLELALKAGEPIGGHLVSGHVDGVGRVISRRADARSERFEFEVENSLARYVARKGSICIDGVSLTINDVDGTGFGVNLIPHTLAVTTLGDLAAGAQVNIEVDLIARYLERLLVQPEGR